MNEIAEKKLLLYERKFNEAVLLKKKEIRIITWCFISHKWPKHSCPIDITFCVRFTCRALPPPDFLTIFYFPRKEKSLIFHKRQNDGKKCAEKKSQTHLWSIKKLDKWWNFISFFFVFQNRFSISKRLLKCFVIYHRSSWAARVCNKIRQNGRPTAEAEPSFSFLMNSLITIDDWRQNEQFNVSFWHRDDGFCLIHFVVRQARAHTTLTSMTKSVENLRICCRRLSRTVAHIKYPETDDDNDDDVVWMMKSIKFIFAVCLLTPISQMRHHS